MLILTLRTDNPQAEIGLFEDSTLLKQISWEAHRMLAETLHSSIKDLLVSAMIDWKDIKGIVCFQGPGSFTGLRIGLSVANSLAAGNSAFIAGTNGEQWQQQGIELLLGGIDQKIIVPDYGAPVHITLPRK